MPLRAAVLPATPDEDLLTRPSWRVSRVARDLDCDPSQVRRLVREGQLEAHRLGKRGVRIFLDSLRSYKEVQRVRPGSAPAPRAKAPSPTSRSHREAMAYLRKQGYRV